MIWQNPWAWTGLAAVALPILIHLLAKHRARTLKFPTLRFVHAAAVVPTRRTRLTDPLLLLVRIAIIACAVAALAQPLFAIAHRTRTVGRGVARAVVVDTSESMRRANVDRALLIADSLANGPASAVIAPTPDPLAAMTGAVSWLRTQTGQRELVVISDFQAGALDSSSIASLPNDITVRLRRIPLDSTPSINSAQSASAINNVTLLANPADAALARATIQAAIADGAPPFDSRANGGAFDVAIAFPRAPATLHTRAPLSATLADVVARIREDDQLNSAASVSSVHADAGDSARGIVVARDERGTPIAYAVADSVNGRERLVLFSVAEPGTLAAAALVAATLRAAHSEPSLLERASESIPDTVLRTWERNATSAGPRGDQHSGETSDGRWLWLAVLALLALETWLRTERGSDATGANMREHDRAA